MGASPQRLIACCLLCCLLAGGLAAVTAQQENRITVAALTPADIQAWIDAAPEGAIIKIPAGVVQMGQEFIQLNKPGLTLLGGPTTFRTDQLPPARAAANPSRAPVSCLPSGAGLALLEVCSALVSNTPTVIQDIKFEYVGPDSTGPAGTLAGIGVLMSGPPIASSADPSLITGCTFTDLDVGVEFHETNTPQNWQVSNNTFDGCSRGVWLNRQSGVPLYLDITDNDFTLFNLGIGGGVRDLVYNINILYNTLFGFPDGSIVENVTAISLSANTNGDFSPRLSRRMSLPTSPSETLDPTAAIIHAQAATEQPGRLQQLAAAGSAGGAAARRGAECRNWVIQNNNIKAVRVGIEFTYEAPTTPRRRGGLSCVQITLNSIVPSSDPTLCSSGLLPCLAVDFTDAPFQSSINMTLNWWGSPNPSPSLFNPPGIPPSIEPWISSFVPLPPDQCPTGFCPDPGTIVPSDEVQPNITSLVPNPVISSPGSTFTLTVTLAAMFDGTITFSSNPAGVSCPSVAITATTPNPVRVTCTLPQTSAFAMLAAASQAAQVQTAAAGQTASAQYGRSRAPSTAAGGVRWFTITATATATAGGRTDTATTKVGVCSNQPWPFRADLQGCHGCTWNCATGQLSCTSCPCHCPRTQYPGQDTNYGEGDGAYGGGSSGEHPYGEESEQEQEQEGGQEQDGYEHAAGEGEDKPAGYGHDGGYGGYGGYGGKEDEGHGGAPEGRERVYDGEDDTDSPEHQKAAAASLADTVLPAADKAQRGQPARLSAKGSAAAMSRQVQPAAVKVTEKGDASKAGSGFDSKAKSAQQRMPPKALRPGSKGSAKKSDGQGSARKNASAAGAINGTVSVAALWHPLVGADSGRHGQQVAADCSADKPQCLCGPTPFVVPAQCTLVRYDACDNTLQCSSDGY